MSNEPTTAESRAESTAKAFPYEDTGPLTVCPCCGGGVGGHSGLELVYGCYGVNDQCEIARRSMFQGYAGVDMSAARAERHALGIHLRAEGKLAPLKRPEPIDADRPIWGVRLTTSNGNTLWFYVNSSFQDTWHEADEACKRLSASAPLNYSYTVERYAPLGRSMPQPEAQPMSTDPKPFDIFCALVRTDPVLDLELRERAKERACRDKDAPGDARLVSEWPVLAIMWERQPELRKRAEAMAALLRPKL
jgi:hypothetical protein